LRPWYFSLRDEVHDVTNEADLHTGHALLTVRAFGLTDPGRVRPSNEDQFLSAELTKTMSVWQTSLPVERAQFAGERGHLFLVADGMGRHQAGEQASALAVLAIEQFTLNSFKWFFDPNGPDAERVLTQFQTAIRQANTRILEEAAEHPEWRGMGTTVTMAFQLETQLCVVHVGDSRAYLFEGGQLFRLTQDHTLMAEMVRRGELRPEQVARHPLRHVITNVVGGNDADIYVESHALVVRAGDCLLLCSDGLTEMLADDAIAGIMAAEPEPEAACTKLVARANEAGGRDNITVLIARFDAADPETTDGGAVLRPPLATS
jgi:serine/threonine protein phosphatase PrpC